MQRSTVNTYLLLALLLTVLCWRTVAQDDARIVLSIQLTPGMEYLENSSIFSDFEVAHPDVKINVIYKPEDFIPDASSDLQAHLDAVDAFTLQADVLMMSVGEGVSKLSLEATRAGYILDLVPLFNADPTADASVYYPAAWKTAQWDGGLWLLPASTAIVAVVYDTAAFDAAGLAFPDTGWRAEDYANAADVLAVRDAAGRVRIPGFFANADADGALVYRFLKQPLYDNARLGAPPQFLRPDTLGFASTWLPNFETGAMFNFQHDYVEDFRPSSAPLQVRRLSSAYLNNKELAELPGGGALVNVKGLVVSGRTHYPQLAYELATYLAADSLFANALDMSWGGMTLARPEYPSGSSVEHAPSSLGGATDDAQRIMDAALISGIPASELLYYPYFNDALEHAGTGQTDIETALRDAEILATDNLDVAAQRRSELAGEIPTPAPEIAFAPGEIELHFYHQEGDSLRWQAFAQEFADSDTDVARVIMEGSAYRFDYTREGTDCFYADSGLVPLDPDVVVDIWPLLAADMEFVFADWLTGTFDAVRQSEHIYALPIDIRPFALWYDLGAQGLLPPQTAADLMDALNIGGGEDSALLASYNLDITLLMLMAANGAVPLRYQAGAVEIDFTSENNVEVIRQVLNLARSGTIKYEPFNEYLTSAFPESEPLLMDFVADSMFRDDDYLPVIFPAGSQYTPVSYALMAGYISRFSQYPEACYRLLQTLARRPDLLSGIPVNRSEAGQARYADFYQAFSQQLMDPNQIIISASYSEHHYFSRFWLFRAFDRYVLENADLEDELRAAEQFTGDYLVCVGAGDSPRECAVQVDPTVSTGTG
jgi:ABC-type glycerol-3-phosphate transport system substrate-binding protein